MSDDPKRAPVEDLKEGLGYLLRAAKSAVERIPTQRVEDIAQDTMKDAAEVFDKLGTRIDQVIHKASDAVASAAGNAPSAPPAQAAPPAASAAPPAPAAATPPAEPVHYDDASAPEPGPGPRR